MKRSLMLGLVFAFSTATTVAQDSLAPISPIDTTTQLTCIPTSPQMSQCIGTLKGYPKRVALFLPSNPTTIQRYYIHLHGHLICSRPNSLASCGRTMTESQNFESDLSTFAYPTLFQCNDSVLIVPESADREATFNEAFSTAEGFDRFVDELSHYLSTQAHGLADTLSISLSGHSGAYIPLGTIAKLALTSPTSTYLPRLTQITLFDASYSGPELVGYSSLQSIIDWGVQTQHPVAAHYVSDAGSYTLPGIQAMKSYAKTKRYTLLATWPYSTQHHIPSGPPIYTWKHFTLCFDRMPAHFSAP